MGLRLLGVVGRPLSNIRLVFNRGWTLATLLLEARSRWIEANGLRKMNSDTAQQAHKARAIELTTIGIDSQAAGYHEAARDAWREALVYAEQHLPGDNIVLWLRSGLGDILVKLGDYRGALEMADSALDYCASVKAPLAALTMVKALLGLGDVTRARQYAQQACDLRGEGVFNYLSLADREALGLATPA